MSPQEKLFREILGNYVDLVDYKYFENTKNMKYFKTFPVLLIFAAVSKAKDINFEFSKIVVNFKRAYGWPIAKTVHFKKFIIHLLDLKCSFPIDFQTCCFYTQLGLMLL